MLGAEEDEGRDSCFSFSTSLPLGPLPDEPPDLAESFGIWNFVSNDLTKPSMFCIDDVRPSIFIMFNALALTAAWAAAAIAALVAIKEEAAAAAADDEDDDDDDDLELLRDLSLLLPPEDDDELDLDDDRIELLELDNDPEELDF